MSEALQNKIEQPVTQSSWLASLRQPDLIRISDMDLTTTTYGCDQDWYPEQWQRQAGCGPCTAATILYYLSRSRQNLKHLYTAFSHAQPDFTQFMSEIWHYVTPTHMGVNEASILVKGVEAYARSHAVALTGLVAKIPRLPKRCAPIGDLIRFIRDGLESDCPVAFLNLSNGKLDNLDSWHWVTVTGLLSGQDGAPQAVIADSGEYKVIDLGLWYQTSLLGGAAVYFKVKSESSQAADLFDKSSIE